MKKLVLNVVALSTFSIFAQGDAILNQQPGSTYQGDTMQINGSVDLNAVDSELQQIQGELRRQKVGVQINKKKAKTYRELGDTTEKLLDTATEMAEQKRDSIKQIEAYNRRIKCLEANNFDRKKCDSRYRDEVKLVAAAPQKIVAPAPVVKEKAGMRVTPFVGFATFNNSDADISYEASYKLGLKFESKIHEKVSIGVSAAFTQMDIVQEPNLFGFNNSGFNNNWQVWRDIDYKNFAVDLTGKFHIISGKTFEPYVGASLGYSRTSLGYDQENDEQLINGYNNTGFSTPIDGPGYNGNNMNASVAGGVDLNFNETVGMNLELKYTKNFNLSQTDDINQTVLASSFQTQNQLSDQFFLENLGREIDSAHNFAITAGLSFNF